MMKLIENAAKMLNQQTMKGHLSQQIFNSPNSKILLPQLHNHNFIQSRKSIELNNSLVVGLPFTNN